MASVNSRENMLPDSSDTEEEYGTAQTSAETVEVENINDTQTREEIVEVETVSDTQTRDEIAEGENVSDTQKRDEIAEGENVSDTQKRDEIVESEVVKYQSLSPLIENQMAASVDEPLLQKDKPPAAKHTSVSGAVFNVSNSIIGAGIMSIPATLKVLGVVPAFVLIVVIAWLADISVEFLMRFTHAGKSTTYAGVMRESFGRAGATMVQVCVMMNNLGCLIVYLIIIGDVLSGNQPEGSIHLGVLQEWFGIHWWNSRAVSIFFIVVFIMLPLVLFRRVETLRFSSAIAVSLAVLFVAISSAMAISALFQGKTETPRLLPGLENKASFFELFTAVPVIVMAFSFHFNVHPIGFEMDKPADMMKAVRISLVLCGVIYVTVGIFGYLLFGDSIMPDILVNFDQNSGTALGSLLNDVVRLSYAIHLMLVFPLINFSLRANIDEFLFPDGSILAEDNIRFMSLTLILLAICYLAAIVIPNIWYFFQFIGSTSAVSLAFIFPGAIALRNIHGKSTVRDRIISTVMISLAGVTSVIAISTDIYNFYT